MRKLSLHHCFLLCILSILPGINGCSKDTDKPEVKNDIWDIEKDGIPKFVKTNYIELSKIHEISKYRSSVGHDYSDATEHCRSLKHYFMPNVDINWATVKIYAPVTGIITRVEPEWEGTKYEIASDDYPAFRFSIFHVTPAKTRLVDDKISEGELLGTHVSSLTYSDISVIVNDPTRQGRMVSYFDVMTDALFAEYMNRGITSRSDLMISKAKRDTNPLTCMGDTFMNTDTIANWVILK